MIGNGIKSDEGEEIGSAGPYAIFYSDGKRSLTIPRECGKGIEAFGHVIYLSEVKNWDGPENKPVTSEDRIFLKPRIRDALNVLGGEVDFA